MSWWHIPTAVMLLSFILAAVWPVENDGYGWNATTKLFLALVTSLVAFIIGGALK